MRSAVVLLLTVVVACFGVWVDGDSSYIGVGAGPEGMFSIGLPPDPPLWPDVRPILLSSYRAESPDGAYFNLYIDGKIYSNTHLISMIYPDSAANIVDFILDPTAIDPATHSLVTSWFIDGDPFGNDSISITQTLTPYENADTATGRMKWTIRNYSGTSHEIGFLLFFDPISISGSVMLSDSSTITSSCIIPDSIMFPTMPAYWEVVFAPGLIAHYDLTSPPNVVPDRIAFGDIHDLLATFWRPNIAMSCFFDLAVLTWWYPATLSPGDSVVFLTSGGTFVDTTSAIGESPKLPQKMDLFAYPNPFNSAINIAIAGVGASDARPVQVGMQIFDITGRLVADLHATNCGAPQFVPTPVIWQPEKSLSSGVYLVRAKIGDNNITKRIVYLK